MDKVGEIYRREISRWKFPGEKIGSCIF